MHNVKPFLGFDEDEEDHLGGIWGAIGGAIGNDIWNRGVADGTCGPGNRC